MAFWCKGKLTLWVEKAKNSPCKELYRGRSLEKPCDTTYHTCGKNRIWEDEMDRTFIEADEGNNLSTGLFSFNFLCSSQYCFPLHLHRKWRNYRLWGEENEGCGLWGRVKIIWIGGLSVLWSATQTVQQEASHYVAAQKSVLQLVFRIFISHLDDETEHAFSKVANDKKWEKWLIQLMVVLPCTGT